MIERNKKIIALSFGIFLAVFLAVLFWPREKNTAPKDVLPKNIETEKEGKKACGFENCHGLDLSCGENVSEMCTMEYQLGDGCRKYARCEEKNERCQLIKSQSFDECKTCVEKCKEDAKMRSEEAFECERACHKKINGTEGAELE